MPDQATELRQAGFSDEEVNQYVNQTTSELKAAGFSDREIGDHFGFTKTYSNMQEQNSLLQRARDYLGLSKPKEFKGEKKPWYMGGPLLSHEMKEKTPDELALDTEMERVLAQTASGMSMGLSELVTGPRERPTTVAGTVAGAAGELAGFLVTPFSAAKILTGTRLAPTASGLKGMAQLLTQGGAQLGIASGLSRIIPAFLEDSNFGNYATDILKSTGMGTLTGLIYPLMGVVPTQPLRIAATLAVMDKLRAGTGQWFTIDDFVSGIKNGSIDKKELGQMAFGYLMDMYFAAKTPSMRAQLKALGDNALAKEISSLDPDKVAQTILDVANTDSTETKIKDLGLNQAVQYEGKEYELKSGESTPEMLERTGLPSDKVIDGYVDKNGDFLTRDKVVSALREGEGIQPDNMRESMPEKPVEFPLEMTLRYGPEKEMVRAATDAIVEKNIKRDPSKTYTEQLIEEWMSDKPRYEPITEKYGMTVEKWSTDFFGEESSSFGRKLGEIGLASQRLAIKYPEIAEGLQTLHDINKVPSVWDRIHHGYKSFMNTYKGILVAKLSTSVRNFEVQMGVVGLDVMEQGLESGLQKISGKEVTVHPLDGMKQFIDVIRRDESAKITKLVLEQFPKQYKELYGSYMADVETGTFGSAIGRGVDLLNTVNRFQEFMVRNGVFRATLEQKLKAEGKDLIKIIEENQVGVIPEKTIQYALHNALEKTFASPPSGIVSKSFVNFFNNVPGMGFLALFPRFFVNSSKFVFNYNPTGFLKLLSKNERVTIANGDMHTLAQATLGTLMLGISYLIRDSEYAGEKFYEINAGIDPKTGKPRVIDTRPFNPFVAWLFIADVAHKANHGKLDRLGAKDIATGILSSNLRAGMGLYAADKIINAFSNTGDPEKAIDQILQMAGEVTSGFFEPFAMIKEFLAGFGQYTVREKRSDPFWGPIKEKLPWVERTLPELYSPTHEGPVVRELPILRQVTGLAISTKTTFEKELDRLGFQYSEIFHSTGNPEADNLIKKHMGELSTSVMDPLVSSEGFNSLGDAQKGYVISGMLNGMREAGKEMAQGDKPELFYKIFFDHMPKREKAMLEETGLDLKALEKQLTTPTTQEK